MSTTPTFFDTNYLEVVYARLFALLAAVTFPDEAIKNWRSTKRCIVLPEQVPSSAQPALYLYQGPLRREQQQLLGPSKDRFTAIAVIYTRGDQGDPERAATIANRIIWGVVNAFNTKPPYQKQTLGNLVYHCFIEGEIVPETSDQQVVITIPITILPN